MQNTIPKKPDALQLQRTLVSLLMNTPSLRPRLLTEFPNISQDLKMLFSDETAIKIVERALHIKSKYAPAALLGDMPELEKDKNWEPFALSYFGTNQDERNFTELCEDLRRIQKLARVKGKLVKGVGTLSKTPVENVDDEVAKIQDGIQSVSTVGALLLDPGIDKIVERMHVELKEGQHQKTSTGVKIFDDLLRGGIHIYPGELIALSGLMKFGRKSTSLMNIVASMLNLHPEMKISWFSNEASFRAVDIAIDMIAKMATAYYRKHKMPGMTDWGWGYLTVAECLEDLSRAETFSSDSARFVPYSKAQTDLMKEALKEGEKIVAGWKPRLRIYDTKLESGNTRNLSYALGLARMDAEIWKTNFIIMDNITEYLGSASLERGASGDERARFIISRWVEIHAQYGTTMCIVSQPNKEGTMKYADSLFAAANVWLQTELKKNPGGQPGKNEYDETRLEIMLRAGRRDPMRWGVATLDPPSGLIIGMEK